LTNSTPSPLPKNRWTTGLGRCTTLPLSSTGMFTNERDGFGFAVGLSSTTTFSCVGLDLSLFLAKGSGRLTESPRRNFIPMKELRVRPGKPSAIFCAVKPDSNPSRILRISSYVQGLINTPITLPLRNERAEPPLPDFDICPCTGFRSGYPFAAE